MYHVIFHGFALDLFVTTKKTKSHMYKFIYKPEVNIMDKGTRIVQYPVELSRTQPWARHATASIVGQDIELSTAPK